MPPRKIKQIRKAKGKALYERLLAKRQKEKNEVHDVAGQQECEVPHVIPTSSTSKRPLDVRKDLITEGSDIISTDNSERILHLKGNRLSALVNQLNCNVCNNKAELYTKVTQCEVWLQVQCPACGAVLYQDQPEKVETEGQILTETNMRMVFSSMINDIGNSGLRRECAILGIPSFSDYVYHHYKNAICKKLDSNMKQYQEKAVALVIEYYQSHLGIERDEDGFLDLEVSFYATWMKRGHTSKLGCGFVIECHTGIVLDFEVLSSYCHACSVLTGKYEKNKITKEELTAKLDNHKKKNLCKKNFPGPSGSMEPECALRMWKRSSDMKVRYTTMVSDGDSSTYKALIQLNGDEGPYGKKHPVIKEECKNHLHN
ncbi:uncharacterized protein LOC143030038 [Oratosquilla oratoria]|uniref:uncharacterized protein LOC143030038 n=1 Tax=Oratosquilla oratoria TaxID=337810 RepID=UPI003F7726E9